MPAIYGGGNPNGEDRVLVDGAAIYLGPLLSYGGYSLQAIVAPNNGYIYTCPASHPRVIKIDTEKNTKTEIGSSYTGEGDKWNGMTVMPNGKIYCAPWGYSRIMKIDPLTDTTSLIGPTIEFSGRLPYFSRKLVVGDTLFLFPANSGQEVNSALLQIDTSTDTAVLRSTGLTDSVSHKFINNSIVYIQASPTVGRNIVSLDINSFVKTTIVNSDYVSYYTTDASNPDVNIIYINKTSIILKNIQTLALTTLKTLPFETLYGSVVALNSQQTELLIIGSTGLNYVIYNTIDNSISEVYDSMGINLFNYYIITKESNNFLDRYKIVLCTRVQVNGLQNYQIICFNLKKQTFVKSVNFSAAIVYSGNIIFDKNGKLWIIPRYGTHIATADIFPKKIDGKKYYNGLI